MNSFPATWPTPSPQVHEGRHVTLLPLNAAEDAEELYQAGHEPEAALETWRYLRNGPFKSLAAYRAYLDSIEGSEDPQFYTVVRNETGLRVGMISVMRITPEHGVAELGYIWYGIAAQRTPVNTESVYLLLKHLFDDLGYRRMEWKCDSQNARSRAAALRLGFTFEGIFRQHMVIKDRNRDTAWFAMTDGDWPARKANFERWLEGDGTVSLSGLNASPVQ